MEILDSSIYKLVHTYYSDGLMITADVAGYVYFLYELEVRELFAHLSIDIRL